MKYKRSTLTIMMVLNVFLVFGCKVGDAPSQPPELEDIVPTKTKIAEETPFPSRTPNPTSTNTPEPTQTPTPTYTPTSIPTQAVLSGIVRRLCPELRAPLGLFSDHGPLYDNSTDPATLYVPYQVVELALESSSPPCTFYLSPPPMGDPQFAGDSLFWKSFDYENEWIMVWNYDPQDILTDEAYPQHLNLRHTRTNTSIGKAGLFDFVVDESGKAIVWSYTDPQPYDENEMGYVQGLYAAETSGPIDQRPTVELWFDFVSEADSGSNIIRPRKFSSDGERVFYSVEPVGLGRQWPEPMGRYSSLYSISTWWDATQEFHFDCGNDYWCISDFSEEQDILITIQDNTIQIRNLSSGELIREVGALEAYNLVRQALIGPDGAIAFMEIDMGDGVYGDPPEDVAIYSVEPPYQGEPVLILSDAGLLNLLGWASPSLLLADGNNLPENASAIQTTSADVILVNVETGMGEWLPLGANHFVDLVP